MNKKDSGNSWDNKSETRKGDVVFDERRRTAAEWYESRKRLERLSRQLNEVRTKTVRRVGRGS